MNIRMTCDGRSNEGSGISYILVHQTGLPDTAVAEDDNLGKVRRSTGEVER